VCFRYGNERDSVSGQHYCKKKQKKCLDGQLEARGAFVVQTRNGSWGSNRKQQTSKEEEARHGLNSTTARDTHASRGMAQVYPGPSAESAPPGTATPFPGGTSSARRSAPGRSAPWRVGSRGAPPAQEGKRGTAPGMAQWLLEALLLHRVRARERGREHGRGRLPNTDSMGLQRSSARAACMRRGCVAHDTWPRRRMRAVARMRRGHAT